MLLGIWLAVLAAEFFTHVDARGQGPSIAMAVAATLVTLGIMEKRGLYRRPALPRTDEISRLFVAVVGGASAVAVTAAFADWYIGAREILIGGIVAFATRILARGFVRAFEMAGLSRTENVVIVGTGYEAAELADLLIDHPESHFNLVGVIGNLAVAERAGMAEHWIGPTGRMIELMHARGATGAIVTATGFRGEQFRNITRDLFRSGYDVHLTTGVSRLGQGRFDVRSLSHEPLVVMGRNKVRRSHRIAKRLIDLVGASVALLLLSPLMLLVAALIWIEDRGPITYTAPRAGRRGQFFRMYKFRSMVINADAMKAQIQAENERTGPLFKLTKDPRITRIGRFIRETSIDELPQLINVLKGDMSLVGPRPALPEEEAAFDEELRDRFEVRPGISGLWQVEARSNAAFNAYRRLDLHYVENWTFALDLRILLATVEQVVVTLALLPLRLLRKSSAATDGVTNGNTATAAPNATAQPDYNYPPVAAHLAAAPPLAAAVPAQAGHAPTAYTPPPSQPGAPLQPGAPAQADAPTQQPDVPARPPLSSVPSAAGALSTTLPPGTGPVPVVPPDVTKGTTPPAAPPPPQHRTGGRELPLLDDVIIDLLDQPTRATGTPTGSGNENGNGHGPGEGEDPPPSRRGSMRIADEELYVNRQGWSGEG